MATGVPYGDYQLIRKIGAGAMAEVFLARRVGQHGFEKQLVIKRLMPHLCAEERFSEMFVNEARLAALIDHPNLAHVSDFGEVDGTFFLAMEYVEGLTLDDFLECVGRVSPGVAARIAIDLLEALHAIHTARNLEGVQLQLVHRDVSTRNAMLRIDGVVKLLDFGIAVPTDTSELSRRSKLMGTRGFMSPEQLEGSTLDPRADLFSVGVLLHRMVTGKMPPEPGPERNLELEQVPEELARIITSALAIDREARPKAARAMQAVLESFAAGCGIEATRTHLAELVTSARRVASSPGRRILASIARHTRVTRMTRLTRVTRPPGSSTTRAKTVVLWAVLGVGVGAAVAGAALRRPEEVPRVDAPRIDPPPPEVIAPTATVTASTVVAEPSEPPKAPRTTVRRSSARPARFGGLAIDTSPWTEVYLDGRSLGITPLDLRKVPRGTHEIELINARLGIREHLRVVIRAGEVTRIYRELK